MIYHVIYNGKDDIWIGKGFMIVNNKVRKIALNIKQHVEFASRFALVDKCTPIEKKAVYLVYGPQLRALGIIR